MAQIPDSLEGPLRKDAVMVNATLESPLELLHYQLRTALTMEADSLAALGELAAAAKSAEITKLFAHHAGETKEQIENLHKVFELLEITGSPAPSPSTKGISRQAGSLIEKSAAKLHDQVVLSCALGNEHYEISAYEALIIPATAAGADDAVRLLQANLEQETHDSEEMQAMLQKVAG